MIELVFFFQYISDLVLYQVNFNLHLHKACLSNTTDVKSYRDCYINLRGFSLVTNFTTYYSRLAVSILCVLYVSLAISWSDISGRRRRPLIFIAIFGQIMKSISGLINHFFNTSMVVTFIFNMIFELIGGINMMFVVAQIYTCETSTVGNRTMRLGLLWVVRLICEVIFYEIAEKFALNSGFYYSYTFCIVLSIIALVLATLLIKDEFVVPEVEKPSLLQLFDVTRIVHSFKLVFKKSLRSKRLLVLLLLIAYVMVYCVYEGENGTAALFHIHFQQAYKRRVDSISVTFAKNLSIIFNTLLCCVILSKCLKIRDVSIGIFAGICNLIGVILYFLVGNIWHVYIATMLNAFHGVILFTSVSFLTKFYDGKEFANGYIQWFLQKLSTALSRLYT
ncbi:uncharacterized protein LOC135838953 isoform X2 [Planococcus citri]|uniref:uncharacterized protein LOC135838953 isoform X2 n=1 Tax=Planococcus citri TaxID=170843 RepID=UPI0031F87CE5